MDTFLICLAIIIAAFAIALFVWWLFKPKRKTVVIRPSTTRPNIIYKQGSGFGLDLGDRRDEEDVAFQLLQERQQAAARWAAEQNRRDQEAQMLQARRDEAERETWFAENRPRTENQNQPTCRSSSLSSESSYSSSSSDSGSSSSCDSGSSSSSSSSSSSD